MSQRTKILIDCDPGHDDAVAILFAARHMDLLAVTTVHGNNTLENTTRNALRVAELAGIDVPIAAGCATPLLSAANVPVSLHGKCGLDGVELSNPKCKPLADHAIDVIIDIASKHRGELVLASIGPETNIAMALKREPKLSSWVREITIMGGSATLGNVTPAAEFNIYCDPEAAAIVFGCGVPIRMVGYNVTRVTGFDRSDVSRMKTSGLRVASVVADLVAFYLDKQTATFDLKLAPMHDVCAVVPYVAPDLIRYLETSVTIELRGEYTRGMTVCDLRNIQPSYAELYSAKKSNARIALEANSRAIIDLVVDTILSYN
jgi:inosine-uridine nucleoside N-ribohydrolase